MNPLTIDDEAKWRAWQSANRVQGARTDFTMRIVAIVMLIATVIAAVFAIMQR